MVGHGQKPPVHPATSPSPHRHVWHGGDTPMATLRNERRGGPIPRSASDTTPSDNALCAQPGGGTRARRAMPLPCPRGVGVQQPRNGKAAGLPSRRPFRLPGSLRCGVQGRPPAGSSHARASRTVPGRLRGYVGRRSVRPSDSTPRRR